MRNTGGTVRLRALTRHDKIEPAGEGWNGRTKVYCNVDGNQGVQLGSPLSVAEGQTLAVDVKETTDEMPTVNVAFWDVTANKPVDWMPNLLSGNRYSYTPGASDGNHQFRVIVSTEEDVGTPADFHVFLY